MHRAKGDFWRLGGHGPLGPPKSAHVSSAFLCSYATFYHRNELHLRLSPAKPMADDDLANLLHTVNKLHHATAARAHHARPHSRLRTPANILKLLHCQKLESLNYTTAAIVLVYLYLVLHNCFRKPRKDVEDER